MKTEKLPPKNYLQNYLACARLQGSPTVFRLYLQYKYLYVIFYKLYHVPYHTISHFLIFCANAIIHCPKVLKNYVVVWI